MKKHNFNTREALQRNSLFPPKIGEFIGRIGSVKDQFSQDQAKENSKLSKFRKMKIQGGLKINILNSFQEPFKVVNQ